MDRKEEKRLDQMKINLTHVQSTDGLRIGEKHIPRTKTCILGMKKDPRELKPHGLWNQGWSPEEEKIMACVVCICCTIIISLWINYKLF